MAGKKSTSTHVVPSAQSTSTTTQRGLYGDMKYITYTLAVFGHLHFWSDVSKTLLIRVISVLNSCFIGIYTMLSLYYNMFVLTIHKSLSFVLLTIRILDILWSVAFFLNWVIFFHLSCKYLNTFFNSFSKISPQAPSRFFWYRFTFIWLVIFGIILTSVFYYLEGISVFMTLIKHRSEYLCDSDCIVQF